MNAIVGFSDLLSDEQLTPDERRDFIAQINQGADDLMRLIDDIIDIAKIEAGQVNVHISECFVKDLFKELHLISSGVEKIRFPSGCAGTGHTMSWHSIRIHSG